MYNKLPKYRYKKTLTMLKEILPEGGIIYDLGVRNPFSEIMEKEGPRGNPKMDPESVDLTKKINLGVLRERS